VVGDGRAERPRQIGMHGGHRLAQPLRFGGEIAAHLVGAEIALAHQVAHAGGGHRPAVRAVGEELGEQSESGLLALHRTGDHAERLRDVCRTDGMQCPVDLGVRVGAGFEPAKDLENGRMPVHDRRVGLFGADHQPGCAGVDDGVRFRPGLHAGEVGVLRDGPDQQRRDVLVLQCVVGHPAPPGADGGVRQPIRQLPAPTDPQLVALQSDQCVHGEEHLFDVGSIQISGGHCPADDLDGAQFLALGREPALVGQVFREHRDQHVVGEPDHG
jgi:hypothetical protein